MSTKEIITSDMIRTVNESIIAKGSDGHGRKDVISSFLGKKVANTAPSDPKSINKTWLRIQDELVNA